MLLDNGQRSPLDRSLGRYPGPVWTLLLWSLIFSANLAFALLLPANNKPATAATNWALAWGIALTIVLAVLADRTPKPVVWVGLTGGIAATMWLAYDAVTPLGTVLFSMGFIIYVVYTAVWSTRRITTAYFTAIAVTYLAVLQAKGALPLMFVSWVVVMTMTAGLALLVGDLMARLRSLATTDPLTGLLNRVGLETRLALVGRPGRQQLPRTLAVLDLDGFKQLNDEQGHLAGDALLREMGRSISAWLRADDLAARTGGDEFTVVFAGTGEAGARAALQRLQASTPWAWSFGLTDWPDDEPYGRALARADAAMYVQKSQRADNLPSRGPEPA